MLQSNVYESKLRNINKKVGEFANSQPDTVHAFSSLRKATLKTGVLDLKTKELIALAIAVASQCDGCIAFHVDHALEAGASAQEIQEALSVAVLMGGGPALVYATHAIDAVSELSDMRDDEPVPRYFD